MGSRLSIYVTHACILPEWIQRRMADSLSLSLSSCNGVAILVSPCLDSLKHDPDDSIGLFTRFPFCAGIVALSIVPLYYFIPQCVLRLGTKSFVLRLDESLVHFPCAFVLVSFPPGCPQQVQQHSSAVRGHDGRASACSDRSHFPLNTNDKCPCQLILFFEL